MKVLVSEPFASLTTNIQDAICVLAAAHRYRRKVLVTISSEIYRKNGAGPRQSAA